MRPGGFKIMRGTLGKWRGGRPCAVFEYRGEAMQDKAMAERLIESPVH